MGILKKSKKTDAAVDATREQAHEEKKSSHRLIQGSPVLVRAIVSEKSSMNEARSVYTFEVVKSATKIDIKNAVRAQYGVQPHTVRMINVEGKNVRFGRYMGRRNDWKKAIVSLPKGTTLDVHEGV